jgi:hypothetical protein
VRVTRLHDAMTWLSSWSRPGFGKEGESVSLAER